MKLTHKKAKGFTLVELLVVIAIIAVLATLASPAILRALQKAKIVTAKGVCSSLETAVINFENEYNYLPYAGTPPTDDDDGKVDSEDDIISVLAGKEGAGSDLVNFKKIRFLELDRPTGSNASNYKGGMHVTDTSADLYDVWGKDSGKPGSGVYHLVLDYDLDGVIKHPFDSTEDIGGKKVIIYSYGPDKEMETGRLRGKNADNPTSF